MTSPFQKFLAAMLSGLLLFLATPGTPGFAFCAWLALVPLLVACRSAASPANAAWLGLGGGLVFYALSLRWITIVLGSYGHLDWWLTGPALFLLSLYMSLFLAIFAAGCRWSVGRLPLPLFAPILWVGLDHLRGHLFSGFPWLDLGYSQFQSPILLQTADLFGHHTVTFLLVMANSMLAVVVFLITDKDSTADQAPQSRHPLLTVILPAALLLAAAFWYGADRRQEVSSLCDQADSMVVTVAQGNIPQDEKWSTAFQQETVNRYQALSDQALAASPSPSLLIWPETALPFYPMESPFFADLVEQLVHQQGANLLFGAPHRQWPTPNTPPQYYNSAFLVVPADRPISGMRLPLAESPPLGRIKNRYDKQHLVPFGEYIPLRTILPFLAPVVETIGDFTAGLPSGPISCGNASIGVLICFESIFPELARAHVADGANLLVNITNDAWFGTSSGPYQHFSMAVFRAVENKRSLARAANTGISGFIDPAGRILAATALLEEAAVVHSIPLLKDKTVYTMIGDLFARVCMVVVILAALLHIGRWGINKKRVKHLSA